MRIAAVDENGKQLELITTSTEVKRGRDLVVADICDAIRALRKKFDGRGQFAGTGIGVPGIPVLRGGAAGTAHQLAGHRAPGLVLGESSRPRSWSR